MEQIIQGEKGANPPKVKPQKGLEMKRVKTNQKVE
jgi:hypothetical protein